MNDELDPVRRLRADVPPPSPSAWNAVRIAVRGAVESERAAAGHVRRSRWRPSRFLAVGFAGLAVTGAAAYGATQLIGVGAPAPHATNPPVLRADSRTLLLGLRVPDPAGGPPWAVRLGVSGSLTRGSSGVEVQVGRVHDDQLGFVGEDNAFHNDGLFHSASTAAALMTPANYRVTGHTLRRALGSLHRFDLTVPAVASAYRGCGTTRVRVRGAPPRQQLRAQERELEKQLAFLRADGPAARRQARLTHNPLAQLVAGTAYELHLTREQLSGWYTEPTFRPCPHHDLRTVIVGDTGPDTQSVTIAGPGLRQTERISANDNGLYLFLTTTPFSFRHHYALTVTCRDGHVLHGTATPSAAGPPLTPNCN
jgi:hypothetical protein